MNIVHALPTTYRSTEFFFKVMCCNISTLTIIVYYNLHMYQSWIKFLRYILQMEKIRSRTVIIWTNDWQDGLLYSQNITAWFAIRSSLNPHKTVRAYKQFKTRVPFCTHFLKQIWYEISHCYIYYIYVVKIAVLKVTMNSFFVFHNVYFVTLVDHRIFETCLFSGPSVIAKKNTKNNNTKTYTSLHTANKSFEYWKQTWDRGHICMQAYLAPSLAPLNPQNLGLCSIFWKHSIKHVQPFLHFKSIINLNRNTWNKKSDRHQFNHDIPYIKTRSGIV